MPNLILNPDYRAFLGVRETEYAIKSIKDTFEDRLSAALNLQRVSAPLFLAKGSGINDDLSGTERKATFRVKDDGEREVECLFSLAKWKRMVLADYGFTQGEGLYTDMNAIRPDEECLDNLHSVYVDQWDWERVIRDKDRTLDFLKSIVTRIYEALRQTEQTVHWQYPQIKPILPESITFVHTEELLERYPDMTPRERENEITKQHGAVFVIGIGGTLADGAVHDLRAPDYDDWTTPTEAGRKGLNGDILLWYPLLDRAFELSSMGIRVSPDMLVQQLERLNMQERLTSMWHTRLLNGELPLSIGGGIGQSRLCMFLLQKLHIGEVHTSVWPQAMIDQCHQAGVTLL
ncbi:MAG: aspartate--ammonia ligase [Phycisphaerae bacterium]|nr:aspartate--ammonia ligase [Phycisphaerae bacterium]